MKNNSMGLVSKNYTISKSFMEILELREFIKDKDCPELDEVIVKRTLDRIQQFPTRQNVSAGGVEQIISITQIFDEGIKDTILACEKFIQALAKNRQFWNREFLKFLKIDKKDLKHFLAKHEEYLKQRELLQGGP